MKIQVSVLEIYVHQNLISFWVFKKNLSVNIADQVNIVQIAMLIFECLQMTIEVLVLTFPFVYEASEAALSNTDSDMPGHESKPEKKSREIFPLCEKMMKTT